MRLCQVCEFVSGRQSVQHIKRPSMAVHPSRATLISPIATRSFTTSQQRLKQGKKPQVKNRFQKSSVAPAYESPILDPVATTLAVTRIINPFQEPSSIPSEDATLKALREISQYYVRPTHEPGNHRFEDNAAEARPASQLLGLDRTAPKAGAAAEPQPDSQQRAHQLMVDRLSDAAYTIVTQPTVVITRQVLEQYIRLQARLGKPQSFPQILGLYASKPSPKHAGGLIQYAERNPSKTDSAVDPAIADLALDAAIEAQDLQAAVGIVENTYGAKAFQRSKLIKKGFLPGFAVGATPIALYYAATELAQLQHALEPKIATGIAFIGAICYVGFTGTIGMVAHFSANDQMKRVTWASGTPLRHRWLCEEERAALDKIACSFGFSEEHRYGEEEGEDFLWLREYILRKSMILDAVELMPGMN